MCVDMGSVEKVRIDAKCDEKLSVGLIKINVDRFDKENKTRML